MAHLSLSLLGPFQATLDGKPIAGFRTNKVRALLAYLEVKANQTHPRQVLATLLWPEREDDVLAPCLQNQAYIALFRGDYARAERLAREALALAQAGHDALTFSGVCFCLGLALGERGQYAGACQAIQTGIERAQASGERHYLPKLLNTMGWLHNEIGDYEMARDWDEQALRACRDETVGRDGEAECYALLNLATDALYATAMRAAERYAREFSSAAERRAHSRYRFTNRHQLLQAELALARGDAEATVRLARETYHS